MTEPTPNTTGRPPKPLPIPFGSSLTARASSLNASINDHRSSISDSENRHSVASELSRQSLRQSMLRLRSSLTEREHNFLGDLLVNGNEFEIQLANENLLNSDVFSDDGWSDSVIQVGRERSSSFKLDDLSEGEGSLPSSIPHMGSNGSAPGLGSELRQKLLEERRGEVLFGSMWKAHQSGLAISRQSSRRSLVGRHHSMSNSSYNNRQRFARSSSFLSSVSSNSSRRRGLLITQQNDDIFRSSRLMNDTASDNNRRVSFSEQQARKESILMSSTDRFPQPELRRMTSDSSRKSVTFGELPSSLHPRDDSATPVTDDAVTPAERHRSSSISSMPSIHHAHPIHSSSIGSFSSIPSIHRAHPVRSPTTTEVSFPSLHLAHPIQSQSFRSTSAGTTLTDVTDVSQEGRDASDASREEKKVDMPDTLLLDDASCNRYDGVGVEITVPDMPDASKFTRPVLMRDASGNIYQGEGVELADFEDAVVQAKEPKVPSREAARRMGSMLSYGDSTTAGEASWAPSIGLSGTFDETMSYGRISSIFRRTIHRSLSDDDLTGIFLGDSRLFLRESSSVRDVKPPLSQTGSWTLDDEDELDYYDPWKVLEDEYENGYGGGGTLPFQILGTSADDVDAHPHVLSPPLMESLQSFLPLSKSGQNFWMKYSLVRDGASMVSFLQHARGTKHAFLAIETLEGEVFGAFTTEPWRKNWNFFGGGESFLWRMRHSRKVKCRSIIDQAHQESEVDVFPFTGENNCVQLCTHDKIAVGGGDGSAISDDSSPVKAHEWGFGLALMSDLLQGTSSPCVTFGSPSLSKAHADGSPFEIINMELWALTPCINVAEAEKLELGKLFLEAHSKFTM